MQRSRHGIPKDGQARAAVPAIVRVVRKVPTAKFFAPDLRREDEARVEHALRSAPGILAVVTSHEDQCVEIEFEDDEIDFETIIQVGREAGVSLRPAG